MSPVASSSSQEKRFFRSIERLHPLPAEFLCCFTSRRLSLENEEYPEQNEKEEPKGKTTQHRGAESVKDVMEDMEDYEQPNPRVYTRGCCIHSNGLACPHSFQECSRLHRSLPVMSSFLPLRSLQPEPWTVLLKQTDTNVEFLCWSSSFFSRFSSTSVSRFKFTAWSIRTDCLYSLVIVPHGYLVKFLYLKTVINFRISTSIQPKNNCHSNQGWVFSFLYSM